MQAMRKLLCSYDIHVLHILFDAAWAGWEFMHAI